MNKNLTVRMGNCNHKKYIPKLLKLVQAHIIDPTVVLSQIEPLTDVLEAYKSFDKREFGWTKVVLDPSQVN
jgi:threonine dehydrogenase-like Zn-dependent dehydrogenase